jgi:NTP pyrophosphatase (non-canonical NTP hydrolase)
MLPGSYEQQLRHFYFGLVGEWGEFCEPLKKHLFLGKPMDDEAMLLELGDVVWYTVALLNLTATKWQLERYWQAIIHHMFSDSLEQNIILTSNVIGRAAEFLMNTQPDDAAREEFIQWLFWVLRYANSIATLYFDSSLRDVMDRNVQKLKCQDNLENDIWEDEF